MIERLCMVLMVLWMGTLSYAQTSDKVEDAAAFLKEMERKASDVGSGEAKWIRRDFSYAFEEDAVGEERRQEFMQMVRFLETNRVKFSTGILGYFRGARVVLERQDWKTWEDWHGQLAYFQSRPKERKACESYLSLSEKFQQGMLFSSSAATWLVRQGDLVLRSMRRASPLIECKGGTLVCLSKGDSARVRDVKGEFKVLEGRFYGREGRVEWERTTNEGDLSAELGAFEVRMKGSSFTTEEAGFRSTLFDLPLEGVLSLKVQGEDKLARRTYQDLIPHGRVRLDDVFPGVSYEGGLQVGGQSSRGRGRMASGPKSPSPTTTPCSFGVGPMRCCFPTTPWMRRTRA